MGHDYATRTKRIRSLLAEAGIDALVASVGADLPYLTGYEALLTERLTMLVLPVDGEAVLVVPRTFLEAPQSLPNQRCSGFGPGRRPMNPFRWWSTSSMGKG